jgi:Flp pilus assembly pilin Flp
MLNLVDKYTEETASETEDGVVAIEYVLMAGLVVTGIATVALTGLWGKMKTELDGLF